MFESRLKEIEKTRTSIMCRDALLLSSAMVSMSRVQVQHGVLILCSHRVQSNRFCEGHQMPGWVRSRGVARQRVSNVMR